MLFPPSPLLSFAVNFIAFFVSGDGLPPTLDRSVDLPMNETPPGYWVWIDILEFCMVKLLFLKPNGLENWGDPV